MPVSAATRAAPSGPRTQWYGAGLAPRSGSEAVDDVEGVELGQAHAGSAFAGEADVGHLCGGEHPVVVEEAAEVTVSFGEPTEHGQQPSVEVTPATTTTQRPMRCLAALQPCSMTTDAYSRTIPCSRAGMRTGRRPASPVDPALGRMIRAHSRPPTP